MFTYTRIFTADEIAILTNDIKDVKTWIDDAIDGKIANCKKRIIKLEFDKALTNSNSPLPSPQGIIQAFLQKQKR